MNRLLAAALVVFGSQAALADDSAYFSNVSASFDAMLNHTPHAGRTATTAGGNDVAEQLVHAALRGERPVQLALSQDAAGASVVRMLNHSPYHGPTQLTPGTIRPDTAEQLVHSRLKPQPQLVHLARAAE